MSGHQQHNISNAQRKTNLHIYSLDKKEASIKALMLLMIVEDILQIKSLFIMNENCILNQNNNKNILQKTNSKFIINKMFNDKIETSIELEIKQKKERYMIAFET